MQRFACGRWSMKKRKISMAELLFCVLALSVLWFCPVHADDTVAQLTLYSYGNSLTGSSNGNVGHAFLSIKNKTDVTLNFLNYPIPAKEMITVSIWPDKMSAMNAGGLYINREMVVCKNIKTSSISIDITQKQLDLISENTPKESYYHDGMEDTFTNVYDDLWHNCTTYSTKMWNLVAPKNYKITNGFLGVDAPKIVSQKINKMTGHQEKLFTTTRNLNETDIFYVTKKRELVPVALKSPGFNSVRVKKNSVSLSWSSCRKWLLNSQSNITGYEVKYFLSDGTQAKIQSFSTENGVISNLKYKKRYKCQVRAVCKKEKYTVYSKWSNTTSFTSANAPKASIKLNKSKLTIYRGKNITLQAKVTGVSSKVKWKSSNSSIATVNNKGKICGKKVGTCKITATSNGKKAICTVIVKKQLSPNSAYKNLIQKYEKKYGKAKLYKSGYLHYWKGLCFAKLLDFNGDGVKELVLVYQKGSGNIYNIKYHVELWSYDGMRVKKLYSFISWSGNNCEYYGGFSIVKYSGRYLLALSDGAYGNEIYYGRKSDGKLGIVHKFQWLGDAVEGHWYYNGKAITTTSYVNYYNKFHHNAIKYNFSDFRNDGKIRSELKRTKKDLT